MYQIYNSTRSPEDLVKYYLKNIPKCYDWTNCYDILSNKYNIELNNKKIEKLLKNESNLKDVLEKNIFVKKTSYIYRYDYIVISNLKKIYKKEVFEVVYRLMAILYRLCKIKGKNIDRLSLYEFDSKLILNEYNIDSKIWDLFYKYLYLITQIQWNLNEIDQDFSYHNYKKIPRKLLDKNELIEELNIVKKSILEENKNIITIIKEDILC